MLWNVLRTLQCDASSTEGSAKKSCWFPQELKRSWMGFLSCFLIWWEDSLTSESFIWIPPVFGDSAVQHCGRFIYCWWPSVLLCKMLNLTMQARYLRFHNLPKCVRSISKGFFAGKEYNSVRKHFVVFSSMIATMEKSHLSNKKRKTHTRKRKKPST